MIAPGSTATLSPIATLPPEECDLPLRPYRRHPIQVQETGTVELAGQLHLVNILFDQCSSPSLSASSIALVLPSPGAVLPGYPPFNQSLSALDLMQAEISLEERCGCIGFHSYDHMMNGLSSSVFCVWGWVGRMEH